MEAARRIGRSGEPWCICRRLRFKRPFFDWPCVLSDRPPVLWWIITCCGWDAVGVNCKMGATTENQGADA